MVPISKSIWPFILFVYLNSHFMLMIRFNSLYCFSKIFFRERSKASPPNFVPPFCALCLIVCDFLPKTWNLGRKEGKSALSGGAPLPSAPVGRSHLPQGDGLTLSVIAARCQLPRRGSFSALSQSFPPPLKPSPWGRWLDAKRQDGRGSPLDSGLALSGAPAPALPKGEPSRKACC